MDSPPVFWNSKDYRTWKLLGGKLNEKLLDTMIKRTCSKYEVIHPALLVRMMEALASKNMATEERLVELLKKARSKDCSPAIKATEILLDTGNTSFFREFLFDNKSVDVVHKRAMEAEVYLHEHDHSNAARCARTVLGMDPGMMRMYDVLKLAEPRAGWEDRRSIQLAIEGKEAETPKYDKLNELFEIYKDWYGGKKDSATKKLISSRYYKENDADFILASARMSADEKDWKSAKMMYDKIVDDSPTYVICEAAETYIAGRDPSYALNLYQMVEESFSRVSKGIIAIYDQKGAENELKEKITEYLDNEYSGVNEYAYCIRLLVNTGRLEMASHFLRKMAESNDNDPDYLVSYSMFLLKRGDFQGSKKAARRAMRISKGGLDPRIQMDRIRFMSGDSKVAEKDIDDILSDHPKEKDALVLKKDLLVARKDLDDALEVCRQILEIDPTDISTMMTLAETLNLNGDAEGSVSVLRNILRLDANRENILKVVGSMIDAGMYREAIFLCSDVEKDFPPDPLFRRLRGNAEYNMGDYLKASASFASAAELLPEDAAIWHSKGMADEARGDFESAEASYERAIQFDQDEPAYWISKASIQEVMGYMTSAVESYNRAIELDPDSAYPLVRKAAIMERDGRYGESLYYLGMAEVTEPENYSVKLMKVKVTRESGKVADALAMMEALQKNVDSEETVIELAHCYVANGKRAQAVRVIEQALKRFGESYVLQNLLEAIESGSEGPHGEDNEVMGKIQSMEDAESLYSMSLSLMAINDMKGAMRSIDRAISLTGEKSEYLGTKAKIMIAEGNLSGAEILIEDACKRKPRDVMLHEVMGDIKLARGEYRSAMQEYDKCISLGVETADIFSKRGDVQQHLGHFDKSIESYETALERDPSRFDLEYILARKLHDRGNNIRSNNHLSNILENKPDDYRSIILFARVQKALRRDSGVTEAYNMFTNCKGAPQEAVDEMANVLEEAGHEMESREISGKTVGNEGMKIKRAAEKVLRRAYTSRCDPTDLDLIESVGYEGNDAEEICKYLSSVHEYGDIVPGSSDFQKMERASNVVIMKMNWKNVEDKPILPLQSVFVTGSFKDVEEAKKLVGYVKKAMKADVADDKSLLMVIGKIQRGMSVYEVMKICKVGVYQARQILKLKDQ